MVLRNLRRGQACEVPVYDFGTHRRLPAGEVLAPRPLVIVDGLWLLHHPEVRRHFELSLFLHALRLEQHAGLAQLASD